MTVFKGFLTIAKRNLNMVIIYLVIFLTIALTVNTMVGPEDISEFATERINIAVIDRDGGELAKGLTNYLGSFHNLKDLPDDQSVLQDRLFYREVSYIVTIPKNFEETCLYGNDTLAVTKVPGSSDGYYIDSQVNTFMNQVRILTAGGFSLSDALDEITSLSADTADVTILKEAGRTPEAPGHSFMFRYMPYILMSVLCYVLTFIMIAFDKPDVKKRMLCSAIPGNNLYIQLIFGHIVIGFALWIVCMLMPVALYGKDLLTDPNLKYYLINSFIMTLVSLSVAFLIGSFIKNENIVSPVVNVLTLGMSFTCGVFVPMDILGKGLKMAARFLPVYWYEVINEQLLKTNNFSQAQLTSIYKGFGIQLLFAAAFLGSALLFRKNRAQEEG